MAFRSFGFAQDLGHRNAVTHRPSIIISTETESPQPAWTHRTPLAAVRWSQDNSSRAQLGRAFIITGQPEWYSQSDLQSTLHSYRGMPQSSSLFFIRLCKFESCGKHFIWMRQNIRRLWFFCTCAHPAIACILISSSESFFDLLVDFFTFF